MIASGDWLIPHLNEEIFLDKPPLQYWAMVAGMRLLGINEWGARLANALWFTATVLMLQLLGTRLWDARTGRLAALLYATSLLPFVAANVLTPDMSLAFWSITCAYCFVQAGGLTDEHDTAAWWTALGLAVGVGILTKGPAILIFLAPLVTLFVVRRRWRALSCIWGYGAALLAIGIGSLWYVPVILDVPGAGRYFLDCQIVGRLFTASYRRNSGLFGGLAVYVPALVLGSLPWSLLWPVLARRAWKRRPAGKAWRPSAGRSPWPMLVLLVLLPLTILVAARSRLPLYVLPLFAPLALGTARGLLILTEPVHDRRFRLHRVGLLALWSLGLLSLKAYGSMIAPARDTAAFARELKLLVPDPGVEVVAVDRALNALPFYGYRNFEHVTSAPDDYPYFAPTETLQSELRETASEGTNHAYIVPAKDLESFSRLAHEAGTSCRDAGTMQECVVMVCGQHG